jgi:hypothetical protein
MVRARIRATAVTRLREEGEDEGGKGELVLPQHVEAVQGL